MQINKMLLRNYILHQPFLLDDDGLRQSGRTTANALRCISEAILNPGKNIVCIDMSNTINRDSTTSRNGFMKTIANNIEKLGLSFLKMNGYTIRYDLFLEI